MILEKKNNQFTLTIYQQTIIIVIIIAAAAITVKLLTQAESQIEAGSPIKAGGPCHLFKQKPGACIRSFTVLSVVL